MQGRSAGSRQQQHQQQHHQQQQVWFDQCSHKFVNLPRHWSERLQRNNLTEFSEFQRNPALLALVFTLMDEELQKMDLASLGLDSTVYSSSAATQDGSGSSSSSTEDQSQAGRTKQPPVQPIVVWRQQRSFLRDEDSDSEEYTML